MGGGDTPVKTTMTTPQGVNRDSEETVQSGGLNADLLLAEIRFWQDMIGALNTDSCSREAAERMHQALALAEYRLASLGGKGQVKPRIR
jgi:hypothetical protein